jgi:hypothetical protein
MAEIPYGEQKIIEQYLGMRDGNVLDFSHATLRDFMHGYSGLDITADKYDGTGSASKANKLRGFFRTELEHVIVKVLEGLREHRDTWEKEDRFQRVEPNPQLREAFSKVIDRMNGNSDVQETHVLKAINDDADFNALARNIRESIDKKEPEAALDRLHTFSVKYFRELCAKYKIAVEKDEPLNAVYGKYIKAIRAKGMIESQMSEHIIRSTFQCIAAFNDVRNNKSYAHDNPVLNYEESVLIFNYMTATLRFIQSIEVKHGNPVAEQEKPDWDTL